MRKVFLHIFSGAGGLSQAVAAHGIAVVNVDTAIHPSLDILDDRIFRLLVGWISSGKVAGMWVGTPCNSFSRARRGKPRPEGRGMPTQLRSAIFPDGFPHLERASDEQAVRLGNALASRARRLLSIAERRKLPSAEENPFQPFLWSLHSRVKSEQHQDHKVDYCFLAQLGERALAFALTAFAGRMRLLVAVVEVSVLSLACLMIIFPAVPRNIAVSKPS